MKAIQFSILTFIFVTLVFLPNTFAQQNTEPQLPEGVKAYIESSGKITGNIQYSPDGKEFAVASSMGIWLYNARTGAEVALLSGHQGDVLAIAYAPAGKMLASAGRDETIRLWDPKTGENLATLTGHGGLVTSIAFSPDGKKLVSGSGDATVRLWSAETRKQIWSADTPQTRMQTPRVRDIFGFENAPGPFDTLAFRWVLAVAYSPDGKILASSGSSDGTIQLWDVARGNHIRTLKGHTEAVTALAFAPDGKTLVSGSNDDTLRVWESPTGTPRQTLAGHGNDVKVVVFSRDGKILASGSKDASVRLWDAKTGRFLPTLRGHYSGIEGVAFAPDGKTVASGDGYGTILLWDWKKLAKSQK